MAPHSGNGMAGVLPPLLAENSIARLIMPTCGPLPWPQFCFHRFVFFSYSVFDYCIINDKCGINFWQQPF